MKTKYIAAHYCREANSLAKMIKLMGQFLKPFIFSLSIFLNSFAYASTFYPLETQRQEAQFAHLLKNLRCLVCQNQDLSDSNASLAKDLRNQVYNLVKENHSDAEITHYLTSRYGDFILFKPPVKEITLFLWFGPILFLMVGCFIFWRLSYRKKK